jgi:hypothetical protein
MWRDEGARIWAIGGDGKADTLIFQVLNAQLSEYVVGLHNEKWSLDHAV